MFYYEIRLDNILVDIYVAKSPIAAFALAQREYPELTNENLTCIGNGPVVWKRHLSGYCFN